MGNLFFNLPAPAGNGVGASVDTSSAGIPKTITVESAYRGTVNIEFSNDGGTTWATISTFGGGKTGKEIIEFAAQRMRVRRSGVPAIDPGLPNVDVASNDDGGMFTTLPVPAGNGLGGVIGVSAFGTFNTVNVLNDFSGIVNVLISNDNVDFSTCMTFQKPDTLSKLFCASFMRIERKGVVAVAPGLPVVSVGAINDAAPAAGVGCWNLTGPFTAAGSPHALAIDDLGQADMSAGPFTFTLPAISAGNVGCQVAFKKIAGGGATITVDPAGADTVDGQTVLTFPNALVSATFVSDGISNWMVV